MLTVALIISFAFLAILSIIVLIVLNYQKSKQQQHWQNEEIYDRLKMLEDGWSIDEVLAHKHSEEQSTEKSE